MKLTKIIENCLIILFFIVVVLFPWTAYFLGIENNLSGAEEKVELSFENLDDYIIQNFPGRELFVRTKNQIMYSFFDVSPNTSITKINDTLISTETLNYYYHGLHSVKESEVEKLVSKLVRLNDICKEKKKKLVIVSTPTKPRYYDGELPFADDVILAYQGSRKENPYSIFSEKVKEAKLNYFDCIEYIDMHKNIIFDGEIPLFYKGAHHWSTYKGNLVGLAFENYLKKNLKIKMPTLKLTASPSEVPIYPDADLFNVLNIYDKPNENFYGTNVEYIDFENEETNYLIQGGSFLGGLLFPYVTIGLNNKITHIENKACLANHYRDTILFEDYDDLDKQIHLLDDLHLYEVIILEVNELNVYNATFGFLDYLLEHKEKL